MVQGSLSLLRLFISSRGLDIGRIAGRLAAKSLLLCADRVLGPAWNNAWRHLVERRHQALARVVIVTSPPFCSSIWQSSTAALVFRQNNHRSTQTRIVVKQIFYSPLMYLPQLRRRYAKLIHQHLVNSISAFPAQ